MPGSSLIGSLAVTLGLNTAAFETGAKRAEARANTLKGRLQSVGDGMKGLALGLGAGIGVAALTGLAKNAFEMASAMDESAQKVGLTVEALQELNLAATQNGVSEEQLAGAIQKMNKSIGALEQGAKPAVDAFAKLGLTMQDLKGKTPDQQLGIIADALNKLPDVQQRVAIGSQIMGKGFSQLLPLINGGSAALDHYAEVSRKHGELTTEDAKRLDELADTWDRLKVRIGVNTAIIIAKVAEMGDGLGSSLAKWETWRNGIYQAAASLATDAVAALDKLALGVHNAIYNGLGKVMDWAKGKIQEVGDKFKWLWDVTVGHSYVPDMVQGIADEFSRLVEVMVDPATSATDKVAAAFQSLQGIVSKVLGDKAGGIFSMITQFIPLVSKIIGGSKIPTIDLPAFGTPGNTPGFASGGSGTFGGFGGVDKNVLSMNGSPIMRVSKGEQFSVSPANGNAPSGDVHVYQTYKFEGVAITQEQFVGGLMATKSDTIRSIKEMSRRG
jgi:hypothetical protein